MKYNVTYVIYACGKDKVVKNKVVEASCQEEAIDFVTLFCSSRLFDNIEIVDVVPAEEVEGFLRRTRLCCQRLL